MRNRTMPWALVAIALSLRCSSEQGTDGAPGDAGASGTDVVTGIDGAAPEAGSHHESHLPSPQDAQGPTDAISSADAIPVADADAIPAADAMPGTPQPSAGCSKPGKPNSQTVTMITVGGTQRTYLLTLPSDYATTTPQRLYFVYHGAGGNHDSMTGYGIQTHAIGVFPDGVGGRWSAQLTGPDIDMFDAVLASVEASACVDTRRIYATGFSFGASMANALGCARGNVLRAFSSVDGGILFGGGAGACKGPIPAWVNHYLMDPTDPYMQDGIPTRDLIVSLNSGANPVAYDAPNPCVEYAGKQPFAWCTPPGAFHQWPDFATASMQRFFDSL
jgi:polyhydroxybutyrate depolymerase